MALISPHGGTLVSREVSGIERETLTERGPSMPSIHLNAREVSDLEMIAIGYFRSPVD